jgi:Mitochondrial degradasome RNA helicase subunit C terminal
MSMSSLYHFAATYAMRKPVALNVRLSRVKPRDVLELSDLCLKHNVLDLYLWLSIRYPEFFVERELCLEQKAFAIECIQESLESTHLQHKFSHSNEYKNIRVKFLTGKSQGLPSLAYGEVRASYEKNIASLNEADLYVFPTLIEEDGGPNPSQVSYRDSNERARKPKLTAGGKPLPIGLLSPSDTRQSQHHSRQLTPGSSRATSTEQWTNRPANRPAPKTAGGLQYCTTKSNLVYNKITKQYENPRNDSNAKKNVVSSPLNPLTKLPLIKSWKTGSSNSNNNSNSNSSSSSNRGTHPAAGTRAGTQSQSQTPVTTTSRTVARTGVAEMNRKRETGWDKLLKQNEL